MQFKFRPSANKIVSMNPQLAHKTSPMHTHKKNEIRRTFAKHFKSNKSRDELEVAFFAKM